MELKHKATAGTLESSDVQVQVEPGDHLDLHIPSSVMAQYGRQIRESAMEVLKNLEVEGAVVHIDDRGALDCTLRSRIQTAVFRAVDKVEDLPWRVKL